MTAYALEGAVGFKLRQVTQRHLAIFSAALGPAGGIDLTPTQFSALFKLGETGACSQNQLGRLTAMDKPTIKGVIDRLLRRGLVATRPDPADARRLILSLTPAGRAVLADAVPRAAQVSEDTLAPLTAAQRRTLLSLLDALR